MTVYLEAAGDAFEAAVSAVVNAEGSDAAKWVQSHGYPLILSE